MRYMFGIVAGIFMLMGVASASETGFGDWGTASYDEVMDSYVINSSSYFSPEPMVNSLSYDGKSSCSSCSSGCNGGSSWSGAGNSYSYSYGPVEYGDDDWDWYSL